MALENNTTGEYTRILVKDSAPFYLDGKNFAVATWKNEGIRNNPTVYDKPRMFQHNFSKNWSLDIDGSTSLDDISTEAYRCLKLEPKYASGWSDA